MPASNPDELELRLNRFLIPLALGVAFVGIWELAVRVFAISKFVLPAPSMIGLALAQDLATLSVSLFNTLVITVAAFLAATILGVLGAILFTQSRILEVSLFPYAVVLQVTRW